MGNSNFNTAIAVATFVRELIGANTMGASIKIARPLAKKDVYVKASHSNKGSEKSEVINRFFNGEESVVTKVTEYSNVTFDRSYQSAVIRRILKNLKAQGVKATKSEIEFTPESLKGMAWVEGWENIIAQSISNKDQYYLRVAINANCKIKTTWLINGKEATEKEIAIIKADLKPSERNYKKQHEAGVAVGDEVDVFTTKIQNLCNIKYGSKGITLKA